MNWWTWTPIRGRHFGRTFSTYVWTDLIHHPIRDTFRTAEPTFQFNVNLTMRLNKTIKTHRQDQFKSCDGSLQPLYQPSITSLGTPLNSHQKLCVNSILTATVYEHWRTLNGGKDHHEWENSPLVLPVEGLWVHTCSGAFFLNVYNN